MLTNHDIRVFPNHSERSSCLSGGSNLTGRYGKTTIVEVKPKRKRGSKPLDRDILRKEVFDYMSLHPEEGVRKVAKGLGHGITTIHDLYNEFLDLKEREKTNTQNPEWMEASNIEKEGICLDNCDEDNLFARQHLKRK